MAACETCWETAFKISRMQGRPQVEVYHELLAANPTDLSHADLHDLIES